MTVTLPAGIWRREAIAELKRSWRLPQFLLPTVLTPAAFYALFTLAIGRAPSPAAALSRSNAATSASPVR